MNRLLVIFGMICIMPGMTYAIRIPLEGESQGTEQAEQGARIGVVDMEMIFKEFPETRRGRKELESEIKKAYQQIEEKKKEVEDLRKEINEMDTVKNTAESMPGMQLSEETTDFLTLEPLTNDTTSQATSNQDKKNFSELLTSKQELLKKKEKELEDFKKESEINLLSLEKRRSKEILNKLYAVLEKIAREERLDIILDKNYVLFGQPAVDVTDTLKKRLTGE